MQINNIEDHLEFGKVLEIDLEDSLTNEKIYLSIDIDWACDEVIKYRLDLVERLGVKATWFFTRTRCYLIVLGRTFTLKSGVHPNFNFLLDGDFRNGKNAEEVIERLIKIIPDAKSIRSHFLVQSERLSDLFHCHRRVRI